MAEPTDEELMSRFCQGDEGAFGGLFARHAPDVQGFLTRMLGNRAAAEDAVQATFLSVVRSRDRFSREARFRPWLFAIAANAARDQLRHNKRARLQEGLLAHDEEVVSPPSGDPGLAKRLTQALNGLNPTLREVVVLHHVMGWTFEEIAETLDTTVGAARLRAHRGYQVLRPLLEPLRGTP